MSPGAATHPFVAALLVIVPLFALLVGAGAAALLPGSRGRSPLSSGASFALGFALLSLVALGPTALGAGRLASLAAAVLAGGLLAIVSASRTGFHRHILPQPTLPSRHRGAWIAFASIVGGGVLLHLVAIFSVTTNYDVLSYHLPLINEFERFFRGEDRTFYSLMPIGYSAAARLLATPDAWGSGILALPALSTIAAASCIHRIAAWLGARRVGRLAAAALFLWHPMITSSAWAQQNDPFVTLCALGAVEALLLGASRRRQTSVLFVSGTLAGVAASAKLSALGIVGLPLAIIGGAALVSRRIAWPAVLIAIAGGALALAPWMVRSTLLAESSFPPVLTAWSADQRRFVVSAHGPQSPLESAYWRHLAGKAALPGFTVADIVPLPLRREDPTPLQRIGAHISILLVAALATLSERRFRPASLLVLAALAALLPLVLLRHNPDRFWMPMLGLLCAAAARWALAGPPLPLLRKLTRLVLGWTLAATIATELLRLAYQPLALTHAQRLEALASLLGRSASAYLNLPGTVPAAGAGSTPSRVLVLFDGRTALFPRGADLTLVWEAPRWAPLLRAAAAAPPGERLPRLRADLRSAGYGVVFCNEFELGRLIAFYGGARFAGTPWGTRGTRSPEFEAELAGWAPSRLAGFTPAEIDLLAEFLRDARADATEVIPAGAIAEIWFAPI